MISTIRRTASVLAAFALVGGAGAGIATAAPATTGPHAASIGVRTWFDPACQWHNGFNWHYYSYCDRSYWHGSHHRDWESFDRRHRGYDYHWRH
ncbi:MAG: hypothetical protein HOQ24_04910 [Mycobacteriaceae bacterium]|nr:hypothetical protein [Mycobacteriaceae bacterium]